MNVTSPFRYPDTNSRRTMARRAWWLFALNLLLPGSAQVVAGNRRLGRLGLTFTALAWLGGITALAVYLFAPRVIYTVATTEFALLGLQVVVACYVVLWVVLTFDTLRLARLFRTSPTAHVAIAAVTIFALVGIAGTASYSAYVAGIGRGVISKVFSNGGKVSEPIEGRFNILLLGGDAGPDRVGMRPDSISVVSVDASTGQTTMIGVPRNLWNTPFESSSPLAKKFPRGYNCGNECLVSFLYTYGEAHPELYPNASRAGSSPGVEAMRDAVEGVLGISIQYYVLIDMQGFADLIDALGGVTINVTERVPVGGDENLRNVSEWIEPGVHKMDGYTALWYSRSRHASTDYDRMARQREVQEAILKQFSPANVLAKFQGVADAGAQVVKTDIPAPMLGAFIDIATKARAQPIAKLELVPPTIVTDHPNFELIHRLVAEALASPSASGTPRPSQ